MWTFMLIHIKSSTPSQTFKLQIPRVVNITFHLGINLGLSIFFPPIYIPSLPYPSSLKRKSPPRSEPTLSSAALGSFSLPQKPPYCRVPATQAADPRLS